MAPGDVRAEILVSGSSTSLAPTTSVLPSSRPVTRAQQGIHKPKVYSDGTVRWSNLAIVLGDEPASVTDALSDKNWVGAMNDEYPALIHNKTWHLVPKLVGKNKLVANGLGMLSCATNYWLSASSYPSLTPRCSTTYYKHGSIDFVLVYVDDIIDASSSTAVTDALLKDLQGDFALKDLGALHYFLGTEVKHLSDRLVLSQQKYATDILHRAGMSNCKPVDTPLPTFEKLSMISGDKLRIEDATKYRSMVGAL